MPRLPPTKLIERRNRRVRGKRELPRGYVVPLNPSFVKEMQRQGIRVDTKLIQRRIRKKR
jgi:hypothetical protein